MDTHTIVFMLEGCSLPIEKQLLPDSARLIHILTDPEVYGWDKGEKKNGVCYMDMKGLGITKRTILEFIRTIRQGFPSISITESDIDNMEHLAILIGAGGVDCPFRQAIDKYNSSLYKSTEDILPTIHSNPYNPMIPPEDIYHIFQWRVRRSFDAFIEGWNVTVQAGVQTGNPTNFYFRKRKEAEQID